MNEIEYVVETADFCFEDVFEDNCVVIRPTNKISDLSKKSIPFQTEKEAFEYADKYYKKQQNIDKELRWLAYLRVCKRVNSLIKEYK